MATGVVAPDRRLGERVTPDETRWRALALLRPGQEVVLVNVSPGGALLESPTRLSPGARAELHLFGGSRCSVRGRVERCRVSRLEPLRYEGAIVFEKFLELTNRNTVMGSPFPASARGLDARESVTRPCVRHSPNIPKTRTNSTP
jgi:hypothetical protein